MSSFSSRLTKEKDCTDYFKMCQSELKNKQTTLNDGTSTLDVVDVLGSIEFPEVKISCHAMLSETYSGLLCA